jgi:hypothetical protein
VTIGLVLATLGSITILSFRGPPTVEKSVEIEQTIMTDTDGGGSR